MNGIFSIMDLCDKHEYVAAAAHHHCGRLAHQRRARLPAGTHQFCVAALHSGPNRQGDVQGPARPLPEQVQVQGQDLSRLPLQRQPAHVATHTRAHRRSNLCTQKRELIFVVCRINVQNRGRRVAWLLAHKLDVAVAGKIMASSSMLAATGPSPMRISCSRPTGLLGIEMIHWPTAKRSRIVYCTTPPSPGRARRGGEAFEIGGGGERHTTDNTGTAATHHPSARKSASRGAFRSRSWAACRWASSMTRRRRWVAAA